MNTNNTAAPSVTIAPRKGGSPQGRVLNFVVTLTTFDTVRSYPCRSLESATKLATRFIAGVTKPNRPASAPSTLSPQPSTAPTAAAI